MTTSVHAAVRSTRDSTSRTLLVAGAVAGPLYLGVGLAQALTRDGFDLTRHALSLLSNGPMGWIQVLNFVVSGLLVLAGAVGVRRVLRNARGGTWGAALLALYGVGLIGAGVFTADPGAGFPPGVPEPVSMTASGLLHFAFGALGFYALIAATFVFARRFLAERRRGWVAYSAISGTAFLVSFMLIASGSSAPTIMLVFYAAVAWIWLWHTAVLLQLRRTTVA